MKIVGLKKARNEVSPKKAVHTQNINEQIEATPAEQKKDDNTPQHKAEKQREIYGFTALTSVLYAIAMMTGLLPSGGLLVFSLLLWFSSEKISESVRLLGQYTQLEASRRIGETLKLAFAQPKTTIYSALEDRRLQIDQTIIDYLLNLPNGKTFAISIRTILPPKYEKSSIRVYFDSTKNQLTYRKGHNGRRYFQFNPVQNLQNGTDWLFKNYRELFTQPAIKILVMANPIEINTSIANSPVQSINSDDYLCIEEVYVVEEAKLITLIEALNQ
ncbi:hypothetical protein [Chroococcus sp. FPU101]|uniref:hypothetical protein n=1 Tax=Chroococcus sp. FPU101 TaxID=1974212 RepID=UPI001A8C152C|nr:hypothetical protein [Chroococcus sp. FPU101]GFE71944.1 hypothetical protein CFPU101_45540 [Chroococcus sp. FPU101]